MCGRMGWVVARLPWRLRRCLRRHLRNDRRGARGVQVSRTDSLCGVSLCMRPSSGSAGRRPRRYSRFGLVSECGAPRYHRDTASSQCSAVIEAPKRPWES